VLESHRGYDIGALEVARSLARTICAPIVYSTVTRLVVDLNRSSSSGKVFSEFTRHLNTPERVRALEDFHGPHRNRVATLVSDRMSQNLRVLHLSVHSFTPFLGEYTRKADIGLLYDPSRANERGLCVRLQQELNRILPQWNIRRNYPYRGSDDGLTTHLRSRFPESHYLGVEIEINQARLMKMTDRPRVGHWIAAALGNVTSDG
jgi:predicted N-formylglutamate amidohydrolase